jgi:hypothetical protein
MAKLYQAPMPDGFATPAKQCAVHDQNKLESCRALWRKGISWYDHSPNEPHRERLIAHVRDHDNLASRTESRPPFVWAYPNAQDPSFASKVDLVALQRRMGSPEFDRLLPGRERHLSWLQRFTHESQKDNFKEN